jgi:hypothetical protein
MNPVAALTIAAATAYLAVCTVGRLRTRKTRSTQALLVAGVLTTAAFAIGVPGIYEATSALLGAPNAADPLSKVLLLVAVAITGHQFTKAANAPKAGRAITGTTGVAAFAAAAAVMALTFPAVDAPTPSPFLLRFLDQPAAKAYTCAALGYLAFIGAVLCPATVKIARAAKTQAQRTGAWLLTAGFALTVLRAPLELFTTPEREQLFNIVSCLAAACVAGGLAAFARHRKQNPQRPSAYVKSYLAEEER